MYIKYKYRQRVTTTIYLNGTKWLYSLISSCVINIDFNKFIVVQYPINDSKEKYIFYIDYTFATFYKL